MSDTPLARLADLPRLSVASLLAALLVAAACDDPAPIERPESVDPKIDRLKRSVESLEDTVSGALEKHRSDTGLVAEPPREQAGSDE